MSADNLISAVYRNDQDEIRRIVAAGTSVNSLDEDGRTALVHAILAENANLKTVLLLIELGTDVNIQDRVKRWTALHFAAQAQRLDFSMALVDAGAVIDATDIFGNTALSNVAFNNAPDLNLISYLLKSGADPTLKNEHGVSTFDLALTMGNEELVRIFESR